MKFLLKKTKASVLQFALLVAVIVAFLLLSFITLTHTKQLFKTQSEFLLQTISESSNGILFTLEKDYLSDSTSQNDTLNIEESFWGGYQKVVSSASRANFVIKSIALTGVKTSNSKKALYLEDNINPLVVVGDTRIEGLVFIPQNGVKAGSIAGKYYTGDQVIYGPIQYSGSELPKLSSGFRSHIEGLLSGALLYEFQREKADKEVKNSFKNPPRVIETNGRFVIQGSATGNLFFKSNSEIIISNSALLKDVTIIAPKVRIEKGFKGRVNIVASDSIIVEQQVNLEYPSSLVLLEKKHQESDAKPSILIAKESRINGVVIYLKENEPEKPDTNIYLEDTAVIHGEVYCQGFFELQGTVEGTVYTHKFLTNAPGGRYINHIFGGKILAHKKEENFCGIPLALASKGIVQWLY